MRRGLGQIDFSFGTDFTPTSFDTGAQIPTAADIFAGATAPDISQSSIDTSGGLTSLSSFIPSLDYNSVTAPAAPASSSSGDFLGLTSTDLNAIATLAKTGLQTYATVQAINKGGVPVAQQYAYTTPGESLSPAVTAAQAAALQAQAQAAGQAVDAQGNPIAPATTGATLASMFDLSTPTPYFVAGLVLLLVVASEKKKRKAA